MADKLLTSMLKGEFDQQVRARGEQYARGGRVQKLRVGPETIRAVVSGSEEYDVRIVVLKHAARWNIQARCACPYGENYGDPCKHIWAVLRKSEAMAAVKWGTPPAKVVMESVDSEEEEWEVEDEGEDEGAMELVVGHAADGTPRRVQFMSNAPGARAQFELVKKAFLQSAASLGKPNAQTPRPPKKPKPGAWKRMLEETRRYMGPGDGPARRGSSPLGPVWYVADAARSEMHGALVVELQQGGATKMSRLSILPEDVARMVDPADRAICAMLLGAAKPGREHSGYADHHSSYVQGSGLWQIDPRMMAMVMPMIQGTGRLLWRKAEESEARAARWVGERAWELGVELREDSGRHVIVPVVRRDVEGGSERAGLAELDVVVDGDPGVMMRHGEIAPLRIAGGRGGRALPWAREVMSRRPVAVEAHELPALLDALAAKNLRLPVDWPESWGVRREAAVPVRARLKMRSPDDKGTSAPYGHVGANVEFLYGDAAVDSGKESAGRYVRATMPDGTAAMLTRDVEVERAYVDRFVELGGKRDAFWGTMSLPAKRVPDVAAALVGEGWEVFGDKGMYRKPGAVTVKVSSGIDWFDLEGAVEFGGEQDVAATIGDVLDALRKGEKFVALGDGSVGMLPEEWLAKHGRWIGLGRVEDGAVRFSNAQLTLVDALLAEMPDAGCDAQVSAARERLSAFEGIAPRMEPEGFRGELRPYQREGLGWLHFLAEFGFGGCLADDMGLGKTVQLLAHIMDRRGGDERPWLVVAPKSLMFNWAREAERFAPGLRVVEHTGAERHGRADGLAGAGIVLTTYATMRLDIEKLRTMEFACVVLDEAQAIKNPNAQAAKAARLLRAGRRIALTGTPVENRLEDLWSIFEFLNPGMLGTIGAFHAASRAGEGDEAGTTVLRRALRPFLLRRTKQKVAPELPARSEQTVACDLEGKQRKLYEELRKHYQQQLLGRVERDGMNKSRMHVLEALLRLRQAACHPALIDPKLVEPKLPGPKDSKSSLADSAKVSTLVEMLVELGQEKHKALVFSQFTSLLALVKKELEAKGITHEYLDGDTPMPARAAAVDRFQSDPDRAVFLISLKAGGVGLNLTAAGYVFLLDPWWNPAVEAQAIDRTHRIGQSKNVIAYRLIAKGTVEERIVELQERKRELAAAIVSESAGPEGGLGALTRQELEWLLS